VDERNPECVIEEASMENVIIMKAQEAEADKPRLLNIPSVGLVCYKIVHTDCNSRMNIDMNYRLNMTFTFAFNKMFWHYWILLI
jgi:hypothetical protein